MSSVTELDHQVGAVRRFTRFYTRAVGLLGRYLGCPLPLTEVRVFYELFTRDGLTAGLLCDELGLDPGYLSRILKRFEASGYLVRTPDGEDRRQNRLSLTPQGRAFFAPYDEASRRDTAAALGRLGLPDRDRLVGAMATIETVMGGQGPAVAIRAHRPGDIGAIIGGQARVYAEEFGWNIEFEALVAEIGAAFLRNFDPGRERAFIAEHASTVVGSVFCVDAGGDTAKLRMLYVDRSMRGTGLGRRLVQDCIAFAAAAGYRRMTLWTNDVLVAARRIYEAEGFVLVAREEHHSFGVDLVGENWDLDLTAWSAAGNGSAATGRAA
jgi:DNA-binding MarR family transcriptional regulator/GNAT superfamily N-acetyltransferase